MARIRTIKPGFFKSDEIHNLSSDTVRLLFIGLWTYVDDEGIGKDDPRLIKAELFPFREELKSAEVDAMLDELYVQQRIIRYVSDEKGPLLVIVKWKDHQKIDRATKSTFPAFQLGQEIPSDLVKREDSARTQRGLSEDSWNPRSRNKEEGIRNKEQGRGKRERESEGKPQVLKLLEVVDSETEVAERLCVLLEKQIRDNGFQKIKMTKQWITDMKRIITIDKRSEDDIETIIRWCQQDDFWYKNIRSPAKLREQFERLVADGRDSLRKQNKTHQRPIDVMMARKGIQ